jgi:hypothetical protein
VQERRSQRDHHREQPASATPQTEGIHVSVLQN